MSKESRFGLLHLLVGGRAGPREMCVIMACVATEKAAGTREMVWVVESQSPGCGISCLSTCLLLVS